MVTGTALVVGEALVDVVQRDGQVLGEHVGGSPLNVAAGLGLLGRPVEFLTWIGDDDRGRRIVGRLEAAGVTLAAGSSSASRTGVAQASLDETGAATYRFDLEWQLPHAVPDAPLVLHTGSIATALDPGWLAVRDLIAHHRATSSITFDPNVRAAFYRDAREGRSRVEEFVALADVVKASDEDLRWLAPEMPPQQLAEHWLTLGPSVVAVTLGGSGSMAICADGQVDIPAYPGEVVDTLGAGDSFMAGLIDALWGLGLLGASARNMLRDIKTGTLTQTLRAASLCSALTVAQQGATPPDAAARDRAAAWFGLVDTAVPEVKPAR